MNIDSLPATIDHILSIRLFEIAGTPINVTTLITFFLILGVTYVLSRFAQKGMRHSAAKWGFVDAGSLAVTLRLLHYLVMTIGTAVALHTIGIDLTALFAAGAVFAIAIGFAMQNIVQNFVSGVILLVERTIKPGDVLEVDNRLVRVIRLGIRATVARTLDDEEVIIPNTQIVQSTVINYTLSDRIFRLRAAVGVSYDSDMREVRRVLEEAAAAIEWRVREKEPRILLREYGDSSVNWEVSVWIDEPWGRQTRRSEMYELIWWALKDAGIVIAYPQMDVHFDPPVAEGLRRIGGV